MEWEGGGNSDAGEAGAIVGDDVVTEPERQVMDVIAALPNEALGVEGVVDFSAGSATGNPVAASTEPGATGLTMVVGNPLSVPLDVQVRLASAQESGDGDRAGECECVCGKF